ncbi:hypothetical protein NPIL_240171 [Nephila pilipes]|uniref:Uncharacterized protein n=1 Tax=Nephila pilipes TaxID=299642 RepID=A0A8X6MFZ8_NEPPI|nr:hypothetical protein NPIL_240171 [Nephila pilipes]
MWPEAKSGPELRPFININFRLRVPRTLGLASTNGRSSREFIPRTIIPPCLRRSLTFCALFGSFLVFGLEMARKVSHYKNVMATLWREV